MRAKNYYYRGDAATINRLLEEYRYIGREADITSTGDLIVYALPKPKPVKTEEEKTKRERASRKNTYRASK